MSLLILCDFPPRVIQKGTKAQPLCMSHWVYWRVSISSFNYPTFTRYECPGGHVCVQRFRVQLSNYVSASSAKSWYPKGCFPPKTIKTIYSNKNPTKHFWFTLIPATPLSCCFQKNGAPAVWPYFWPNKISGAIYATCQKERMDRFRARKEEDETKVDMVYPK